MPIWPREDLPLLTVEIDHLCWISQLEATIKSPPGHTAPSPPLDPHACRFGHWLDLSGRDRYGSYASFQHVEQAHERVHAVGCEIDRLAREDREAARRASVQSDIDRRRDSRVVKKNQAAVAAERERMAEWLATYHKSSEEFKREEDNKRNQNNGSA